MRGIISRMLKVSIKKGITLNVLRRYLKIKYRISVSEAVLAKRKNKLNNYE